MFRAVNLPGILAGAAMLMVLGFMQPAFAVEPLSQGTFSGRSRHKVSGDVSIVKTDKGSEIRFGSNFLIDSAPGPYVGFGKDGKYDKSTQFSKLKKRKGAQTYAVPSPIDVSKFNEVYVWCKPFNVPLGVAKLK